jgi:hypothetical protein
MNTRIKVNSLSSYRLCHECLFDTNRTDAKCIEQYWMASLILAQDERWRRA